VPSLVYCASWALLEIFDFSAHTEHLDMHRLEYAAKMVWKACPPGAGRSSLVHFALLEYLKRYLRQALGGRVDQVRQALDVFFEKPLGPVDGQGRRIRLAEHVRKFMEDFRKYIVYGTLPARV
jgi:hypothetical protein